MFRPNPTTGYQGYQPDITGYQGHLYTGYELSPLGYQVWRQPGGAEARHKARYQTEPRLTQPTWLYVAHPYKVTKDYTTM